MDLITIWVAVAVHVAGVDGSLVTEISAAFPTEERCAEVVENYKKYAHPRSYSFFATCVKMVAPPPTKSQPNNNKYI